MQKLCKYLGALLPVLFWLPSGAQPVPNPPFTINRKVTLAQANKGGRVDLDYNLTGWPAKSMVVTCYRYQGPAGTTQVREWKFTQGQGRERLDFKNMPAAQYVFTCTLLDQADKPLPLDFRPVQLEYGGWTGRLRNQEATARAALDPKAPLGEVPVGQVSESNSEWVFKVSPEALVVKPGGQAVLAASLNSRPVVEELQWSLEGPGKIQVVENFLCYYRVDKQTPGGQRATIRVFSTQHPTAMKQEVQVLITQEPVPISPSDPTSE